MLHVNFTKRFLNGINFYFFFWDLVEEFLHCKIESFPIKYSGLHICVNPHMESSWEPLISLLSIRLVTWKNNYVSSGVVILLNLVLNSIIVFYLFSLNMPVKI